MAPVSHRLVQLLLLTGLALVARGEYPPPFTRQLSAGATGTDVFILQNLLRHLDAGTALNASGVYDQQTETVVLAAQALWGLNVDGIAGVATLTAVLQNLSDDNYTDSGVPAEQLGYHYKIVIPVHRNRSIETTGWLEAGNGTRLLQFTARAHGYNDCQCNDAWPNFNSSNIGLCMFADDGNTVTGLMEADLNSPEDDPKAFGPYPVNRAVQGLQGNAAWLVPAIRNGILLHTGEWPGWAPPAPMPNSEGCIHSWPDSINRIQETLVMLGVQIRPNTDGKLPYPYKPQGLLSVYLIHS